MSTTRLFDAVRKIKGSALSQADVNAVNAALAAPSVSASANVQRISADGLALVKASEGLRLNAYRCPADVSTIGYGSTGPHVRMGMAITEAEADALLKKDLHRFEVGVAEMVGKVPQGMFDSLVSFAFNLGLGALSNSTLLKKHKAGDTAGAAMQFARWDKAGGRVLAGLTKRRKLEAEMYLRRDA